MQILLPDCHDGPWLKWSMTYYVVHDLLWRISLFDQLLFLMINICWLVSYKLVLHFRPVGVELVSGTIAVETQSSTDNEISGFFPKYCGDNLYKIKCQNNYQRWSKHSWESFYVKWPFHENECTAQRRIGRIVLVSFWDLSND